MSARRVSVVMVALVAGCGGGHGPGTPVCDGLAPAGDAPEWGDVVGTIYLVDGAELFDDTHGPARQDGVDAGAVFVDRAIPGFVWPFGVFVGDQTVTAADGACRLLEHHPVACDPACGIDEICVEPGVCFAALAPRSAGPITFAGTAEPVVLAPAEFALSGYRLEGEPAPGIADECAAITAAAPGDVAPAVSLTAVAVAGLDPGVVDLSLRIDDDRDLELSWEPADPHGRVRLRLLSPNRGHGTPVAAILECDVPDRGELVVPHALIARMPPSHDEYCAGYDCPSSQLLRYHRATQPTAAGVVELIVATGLEFRIVHNPEQVPE